MSKAINPWIYVGSISKTELARVSVSKTVRQTSINSVVGRKLTCEAILPIVFQVIEEVHGITKEQILAKNRLPHVAYVRQLIYYWMKQYYSVSVMLTDIGKGMQRDYSTVLHGIKAQKDRLDVNEVIPCPLDNRTARQDYQLINDKILKLCS